MVSCISRESIFVIVVGVGGSHMSLGGAAACLASCDVGISADSVWIDTPVRTPSANAELPIENESLGIETGRICGFRTTRDK